MRPDTTYTHLLRDSLLIIILLLSLVFTRKSTGSENFFTREPILEIGKLFSAIFLTIIPMLAILKAGVHGVWRESSVRCCNPTTRPRTT